MNDDSRKMLIKNGGDFKETGDKPKNFGGSKDSLRTFDESQEFLRKEIKDISIKLNNTSSVNLISEVYVSFKRPEYYTAKSYDIHSIYEKSGLERVATNKWIDDEGKNGNMDIVRGSVDNVLSLDSIFEVAKTQIIKKEMDRISGIDLLDASENIHKLITDSKSPAEKRNIELSFYSFKDTFEVINKLNQIISKNIKVNDFMFGKNIIYLNLKLSNDELSKLAHLNVLRSAYNIYDGPLFVSGQPTQIRNLVHYENPQSDILPVVGIIDGGVHIQDSNFFKYVDQKYMVPFPESSMYMEHGTSVASVIMYGDINNDSDSVIPQFKIESIRGLPSEQDNNFNLTNLESVIEYAIPKLKNIKVWNISVGPLGPVLDEIVSSITELLDRLAYENDILFVIAAGNTGRSNGFSARLQSPADSVNNFAVNSYVEIGTNKDPASYNSIGPGREGGKLKPDFMDHGGLENDPIHAISTYDYLINNCFGTSFAAPMVSRKIAELLWKYPELNVLSAKALVTQFCALNIEAKDRYIYQDAKGVLPENVDDIVESPSNEFRIMFEGSITAGNYVKLILPEFAEYISGKNVEITWTTAVKTPVDASRPDAYTEYGIEDDFYSDSSKYDYRLGKTKRVMDENKESVLLNEGYKKSTYPSKTNINYMHGTFQKGYINEEELRNKELKWDTIKSRKVTKRATSLKKPFLRVHGISRNNNSERISYVIVVSIRVKNDLQLYDKIMENNNNLLPLTLRNSLQNSVKNKI